jgi:hypothetical protein
VQDFTIDAMIDGQWKTVYAGTEIGGDCGLVFEERLTSSAFRVVFNEWNGGLSINAFELLRLK